MSKAERAFLATCLAERRSGMQRLADADAENHFTGDLERQALLHLREHLADPMSGLPADPSDPLTALIADLLAASDGMSASPQAVEFEWLQLEKLRLDRRIDEARRTEPAAVGSLAIEREAVKRALDAAADKLEEHSDV